LSIISKLKRYKIIDPTKTNLSLKPFFHLRKQHQYFNHNSSKITLLITVNGDIENIVIAILKFETS